MYADDATEDRLKALEDRIIKTYTKAYKEVESNIKDYFEKFKVRDEEMREALKNGTYMELTGTASAGMTPEQHYNAWRLAQIGRGERWETVRDNLAKTIANANSISAEMINNETPKVYGLNHDYVAYEIEQVASGVSFSIYDDYAAEGLMQGENHTEFRTLKTNPKRDYAWNYEKIQAALTRGIVLGKSIDHLADSFVEVMGSNRKAAIRNARTAVTSAQNAGRLQTMYEAQGMGIEVRKEWLSAHDGRVRDSHAHLDGVKVDIDKKFPNGCMYPADTQGAPAEVYNCRCSLLYVLPKYSKQRTNNTAKSYNEWREGKTSEKETSNKGINKSAVVNKKLVNSAQYKNAINALGEDKITSKKITKAMRKTLDHRDGTLYEDLTFINSDTHISNSRCDYNVARECRPSKAMLGMLEKKGNIIAIHNHPTSTVPSFSDITVNQERKYKYGLIACHNGKIYKYSVMGDINRPIYEAACNKLDKTGYTDEDLKKFAEEVINANVRFEVIL